MFHEALKENNNDTISSTFLITMNTNKAATSQSEAEHYRSFLMSGIRRMFEDFEQFVDIYIAGYHVSRKKANIDLYDVITNVRVNPQIEIGSEKKRIHTHIIIKWDHSAKYYFQINMSKLRAWIETNIGPMYLNIRWIKMDSDIFRYINKSKSISPKKTQ